MFTAYLLICLTRSPWGGLDHADQNGRDLDPGARRAVGAREIGVDAEPAARRVRPSARISRARCSTRAVAVGSMESATSATSELDIGPESAERRRRRGYGAVVAGASPGVWPESAGVRWAMESAPRGWRTWNRDGHLD